MATFNFTQALKNVVANLNKPRTTGRGNGGLIKTSGYAERPVDFNGIYKNGAPTELGAKLPSPVRFIAGLPEQIVEDLANVPNRVLYNVDRLKTAETWQDKARGLAGLGLVGLDLATLGVGGTQLKVGAQLGKTALENGGKQTFKELLKVITERGIKENAKKLITSEGAKIGLAQGAGYGVTGAIDADPNATPLDIGKSATITGLAGGVIGAVAEPVLKYGTAASRAGYGEASKLYKASRFADQSGFVKPGEVTGTIDRLLSGKSKAFNQELPESVGQKLSAVDASGMLKKPTGGNIKALMQTHNDLSRSTLYKSFDQQKALGPLSGYVDTLGGDVVLAIKKETMDGKVMKASVVKEFWGKLKEAAAKKDPTSTIDDQLLGYVDNALSDTPKTPAPSVMKDILKPTVEEKAVNTLEAANTVIDALPSKHVVDQASVPQIYQTSIGAIKQAFSHIQEQVSKLTSVGEFVDMIEGKIPTPEKLQAFVDAHHTLVSKLRTTTENSTIGEVTGGYFPHSLSSKTGQVMDELFPGYWIDRVNMDGGNLFGERTGSLTDYSKDYSKVMNDYTEQAIYEKYRGSFQKTGTGVEKIVDHIRAAGDTAIDYVDILKPETPKAVIDWKTHPVMGFMRTVNNVFENMKGQAPELFHAYRRVRDIGVKHTVDIDKLTSLLGKDGGEQKALIYLAKNVFGLTDKGAKNYIVTKQYDVAQFGIESFISRELSNERKMRIQDLVQEAASYEYSSGRTKETVNEILDNILKKEAIEPALLDGYANTIMKTFYAAHLGLNAKVAVLQGLEISRLPANFSKEHIYEGLKLAFTDGKRLLTEYDFKDKKNVFLTENDTAKTKLKEQLKSVPKKAYDALFAHIDFMEKWKNAVYAGSAEAEGKALNKTGQELKDHVRDSVYKYAHLADSYNTPLGLMNKEKVMANKKFGNPLNEKTGLITQGTIARLATQYSQFFMKSFVGKVDAITSERYGEAAKLVAADLLNMYITMTAFGTGKNIVENALGAVFPVGLGPALTIPGDLVDAISGYQEAKDQGYSTDYTKLKLQKLLIGSFVPAGTQINKTYGQVKTMLNGFSPTAGGLVAYPESGNAMENLYGLIFGANTTSSAQQYYADNKPYLRENYSEVYKQLYAQDPEAARKYYHDNVELKKQKGNLVTDILKGNINSTAIKTADDGSLILPTPSGNIYNIQDMLVQDAQAEKKNNLIGQIVMRKDQFEALPAGQEMTQQALTAAGISSEDYRMWTLKKVNSTLSGEAKAKAFATLVTSGDTSFTELYKLGILTTKEIGDLEKYGYIESASDLEDKLKLTDAYYIKKEKAKISKKTMQDILKSQAQTAKQMIDVSAKRQSDLLKATAKVSSQGTPRLPSVKLPSIPSLNSLKPAPRKYEDVQIERMKL